MYFKALYTKDLVRKAKRWQDGFVIAYSPRNMKLVSEEDESCLGTASVPSAHGIWPLDSDVQDVRWWDGYIVSVGCLVCMSISCQMAATTGCCFIAWIAHCRCLLMRPVMPVKCQLPSGSMVPLVSQNSAHSTPASHQGRLPSLHTMCQSLGPDLTINIKQQEVSCCPILFRKTPQCIRAKDKVPPC